VDDWLFGEGAVASKPMSDAPRADGLDPEFGGRLDRMLADAPGAIDIRSGKRDAAEQKVLYDRYQAGVGALAAWSNGVDCASDHCKGTAADLIWPDEATMRWAHDHAADYGLSFSVPGEDWHVSLP
jgi:LAS superfamily LD-carboxypeptidase LdcB